MQRIRKLSSVQYSRKSEQVLVAPKPLKQISRLQNGVTLVTIDDHLPQSSVAVYLNSGTRHESPEKPGAGLVFKKSLVRSLPNSNVVKTVMETEFRGNSLYADLGREHLLFASELLRDDM